MGDKLSQPHSGRLVTERPEPAALVEVARRARLEAYCPYSEFAVGAAVLAGPPWVVFSGCNVENSAYSETICAERVALVKAVSEGQRHIRAVAVVAAGVDTPSPCGACLQVMAELAPGAELYLATPDGSFDRVTLCDLLPRPFTLRSASARMTPE
jgi:cytidine deaminase